jgi:hypothetical protein
MAAKAEALGGIALKRLKIILYIARLSIESEKKAGSYSVDVGFPEVVRDVVLGGEDRRCQTHKRD